MKVIWATSFRDFGLSKINDYIQYNFLKKIFLSKNNIKICLTQFGEKNILNNIKNYKKNIYYYDCSKQLPKKTRYSQTLVLHNALSCLLNRNAQILIWSTADIEFLINDKFLNFIKKDTAYTIFPNIYKNISNKKEDKKYTNFGLDIFIFYLSKKKIKEFIKMNKLYSNFDWGCFEHFLMAVIEKLDIKIINLYAKFPVYKYDNERKSVFETRTYEIYSWKKNQKRLINFLKKNKISKLYATGSMYYLAFKLIKNSIINLDLILIYFKLSFKFLITAIKKSIS